MLMKLVGIIVVYLIVLISLGYSLLQHLNTYNNNPSNVKLSFPRSLSLTELQLCHETLRFFLTEHFPLFFVTFTGVYHFKQTFAIPGSAVLNLLAGFLFPFSLAFPIVCFFTMCGASSCFLLSKKLATEESIVALTNYVLPEGKLDQFRQQINQAKQDQQLFYYLLFIRIFPFTPNWFINLASPWLNVPLPKFALSVLFGLMPYNFITVKAGAILSELKSTSDVFDVQTICWLVVLACLSLVPILFGNHIKQFSAKNRVD